MKKFFASGKVKQAIDRGRKRQNDILLVKAMNTSLANNFVSDFTSLIIVVPHE